MTLDWYGVFGYDTYPFVILLIQFFNYPCMTGVLNKTFDKNETYPDKLIKGCGNKEVEYTGVEGSMKCLSSGHGEISFVDSEAVRTLNEIYRKYRLMH